MADYVPVKAYISRALRRRAFAAFVMLDTNYSRWTREHLERWLEDVAPQDERSRVEGPGMEHPSDRPGQCG